MKRFYSTFALMVIGAALVGAQTITLFPSGDMTTNDGQSGMSPPVEQLWIANWIPMQNFQQTLIRFDLSAYAGYSITNATLNLYQFFHAPDGTPTPSKIYAITEDWDEDTWPANTHISHGTTEYAAPVFTTALGWYPIDINDLVAGWIDGSVTNYGLVIIANSGTKFAEFYSKDNGDMSLRPYLEFDNATAIHDDQPLAERMVVYPNPMTQSATVQFFLIENQRVSLTIHDILGKEAVTVAQGWCPAGEHKISLDRIGLLPGIYWVRLQAGQSSLTRKLIVE